jgi:hypothetical protein
LSTKSRLLIEAFFCSDPRDFVYGLYGICVEGKSASPDYKKSAAEIYSDSAADLVRRYRYVDVLPFVEDESLCYLKDLPSWVPDLRSALLPRPLIGFEAGRSLDRQKFPVIEFRILCILAMFFGSITKSAWASGDINMRTQASVDRRLLFLASLPFLII